MKYVINANYGGFHLPEEFCEMYGMDAYDDCSRFDERLVEFLEAHPHEDLKIIEIPDNATDWELDEYDGWEELIVVIDGKIKHIG